MIRRSWLNFLCVLALVLGSLPAHAQEMNVLEYVAECDGEDPSMCAQPLRRGEVAPFDGQLISPELAISLGQRALNFDIELTIELDRQQQIHELALDYQKEINALDKKSAEKQIALLEERLEEAQKIAWYRTPAFVGTTVCVATVLILFGSAYLLQTID